MNEQDRSELERLRKRQLMLEQEMGLLSTQLKNFEQRLRASQPEPPRIVTPAQAPGLKPREILQKQKPAEPQPLAPKPIRIPPPPIIAPPPQMGMPASVLPASHTGQGADAPPIQAASGPADQPPKLRAYAGTKNFVKGSCTSCGGHLEFPASAAGDTIRCPHCGLSTVLSVAPAPVPVPLTIRKEEPGKQASGEGSQPPVPPLVPKAQPAGDRSFEMRLGTYWLVRIGIVMLVTGLVFFGNLAYQNVISKLGPGGKVSLLYAASALLLGAGAWWQRKAVKESLKNYAQVLFAGGLALVYFTTFAAHHIEKLRVISSAGWDGALLLLWAGFIVWIADRKKSEVLALFAVLLAYYSLVITHVEMFTLYANLVLTLAAVFFLVRNRWAVLSFVSLAATYAAYGYWRFCNGQEWHWASPQEGLWTGIYFLIGYWIIFTAAVFLSRDARFSGQNRASFLTVNNGAFFTLFLLTMYQVHHAGFWKFALIYGTALLGLAAVARLALSTEPLARNSYLTQGLLLATVGIISNPHLAGLNLALILATESVILLMTGQMRKNLILLTGAYLTAALAVGWGMDGMMQHERHGLWLAVGLGLLMMVNTLLVHRHLTRAQMAKDSETGRPLSDTLNLRPQPSYFTVLALVIWIIATWNNAARENFSLVVAVEATLLILSVYVLRVREITLLSLGYLGVAQLVWIFDVFGGILDLPWWNPALMLLLNLGVAHWWQRQKVLRLRPQPEFAWLAPEKLSVFGKNLVLLTGADVAVKLGGGWDIGALSRTNPFGIYLPIGLGALMMLDTFLHHRQAVSPPRIPLRPQVSFSTALALAVWLAVTWHHTSRENFPLVLASEAVGLTLSFYLARIPEITLLGQGYLLLAELAWFWYFGLDNQQLPPWWNPVLLIGITLGLSHWWQKQKVLQLGPKIGALWQALYGLAIVLVFYFWLSAKVGAPVWLALTSLLAVGLTAYGVFTRAWFVAAWGQIFILVSGAQFIWQLAQGKPHWPLPLVPIAALGLLSLGTVTWFHRKPDASGRISAPLLEIARLYRWVALLMSIWWICQYVPARERIWLLALLGFWIFNWAGWQRNQEALLFSAAFTLTGLAFFWLPLIETRIVYWPNLVVIILLLCQRQMARRFPDRYRLHPAVNGAIIIIGGCSLWRFLSLWVLQNASGFYLTASWSALALAFFAAGIALRERVYRWLGFGVLACALGRIIVFDVWTLDKQYRVLSFMALGIVLLVLGFIYNKYQEKIREWL